MSAKVFTVDNIPFGDVDSVGAEWHLSTESGWYGGPGVRGDIIDRPYTQGEFDPQRYRTGRQIVIAGTCTCPDEATALDAARRFAAILGDGSAGTLEVDQADGTLTASVRLDDAPQFAWITDAIFQWQLTLRAADPLKYGGAMSDITGMPVIGGGLTFSPGSVFDFGTLGSPGVVDLANPGTADTTVLLRVAGPVLGGFQLTETGSGSVLRFVDDVASGSWITIDTGTGQVLVNDQADRRGSLTVAQFSGFNVPAQGSIEIRFDGLTGYAASALLTATIRPAYR